jgi:hypothetical protein
LGTTTPVGTPSSRHPPSHGDLLLVHDRQSKALLDEEQVLVHQRPSIFFGPLYDAGALKDGCDQNALSQIPSLKVLDHHVVFGDCNVEADQH